MQKSPTSAPPPEQVKLHVRIAAPLKESLQRSARAENRSLARQTAVVLARGLSVSPSAAPATEPRE